MSLCDLVHEGEHCLPNSTHPPERSIQILDHVPQDGKEPIWDGSGCFKITNRKASDAFSFAFGAEQHIERYLSQVVDRLANSN